MSGTVKGIIVAVIALVVIVILVIGVLIGAGVFGWRAALRSGNEAATLQDLKTIAALEVQYFNMHDRKFGTLDQMVKEGMLDARFSKNLPVVDGYIFTLKVTPKTASQPNSYTVNADPQSESTGKNHFYMDSYRGAIHVNGDQPASPADPPFGG